MLRYLDNTGGILRARVVRVALPRSSLSNRTLPRQQLFTAHFRNSKWTYLVQITADFTFLSLSIYPTRRYLSRWWLNLFCFTYFTHFMPSTGCFNSSGLFDSPLTSWQDFPILMSFEWVNKHTGRFVLRYNNAWYMARWLYKGWE